MTAPAPPLPRGVLHLSRHATTADTAITPRVLSQHALERVAQRQPEYRASKHSSGKLQRSQAESTQSPRSTVSAPGCQRAVVRTRRTRMRGSPKALPPPLLFSTRSALWRCPRLMRPRPSRWRPGWRGGRRPPTPGGAPAGGTASGAKAHPVLSGLQRQSERDIGSARAGARGRNNIGAASRALALASCDRDRDRDRDLDPACASTRS